MQHPSHTDANVHVKYFSFILLCLFSFLFPRCIQPKQYSVFCCMCVWVCMFSGFDALVLQVDSYPEHAASSLCKFIKPLAKGIIDFNWKINCKCCTMGKTLWELLNLFEYRIMKMKLPVKIYENIFYGDIILKKLYFH